MLALGRIGECWPQLDVIKVEGCDVPKARVGVFVARPVGLSLVSKKMLRIAAYPLLATFRFNRRLTGRGVQRTRTLYYGDLSIEICLDCDASFGFDIDMGSWGYWNLIESIGFGMRKKGGVPIVLSTDLLANFAR